MILRRSTSLIPSSSSSSLRLFLPRPVSLIPPLPTQTSPSHTLPSRSLLPRNASIFFFSTSTAMAAPYETVFAKDAAPPAGPYSHAIKANGLVFASGQIPCTADGQILTEGTIGEKTALVIQNVKAVLEAAGSSLDKVVKVTVFLTDMANFPAMNAEYEKHFTHKPARSCVAVKELPKGVPVEIEVVALQ